MATLLVNLPANADTTTVSLSDALGTPGDEAATITIGAETMNVISGVGTREMTVDRGVVPIIHAVRASVSYSAGATTTISYPTVTSEAVNWDDSSPLALTLGPLLEGHTYQVLFEEVIENDAAFALQVQKTGDATTVVGAYSDGDATAPSTVIREILTYDVAPTFGINAAPYIVVKTGQGPVTLEAAITPGVSQSTGQTKVFLLDWPLVWIA